jgi:hypothetical protein
LVIYTTNAQNYSVAPFNMKLLRLKWIKY